MKRYQKRLRQMRERSDVIFDDIRKAEEEVAEATARFYADLDATPDDDDDDDDSSM